MEKKERTVEEIGQEYGKLCQSSGHIAYQIKALQMDLEVMHKTMLDLNLEAAKLKQAQDAAKQGA